MDSFDEDLKELIPMFFEEAGGGLESPESRENRHLMDLKEVIERYSVYFAEGFEWFLNNSSCKDKLQRLQSEEGAKNIAEYLNAGHYCLGTPLHLTDEDYSSLYQQANKALESDLPLARSLYTTLIFLNFTYVAFWIGLAITTSRMENIPETEMIYKLAIFLNPLEPSPYLYYGNYLASLSDPRADLFLQQGQVVKESIIKEGEIV